MTNEQLGVFLDNLRCRIQGAVPDVARGPDDTKQCADILKWIVEDLNTQAATLLGEHSYRSPVFSDEDRPATPSAIVPELSDAGATTLR